MMVQRKIGNKFKHLAKKYPVVTLTGPRQTGKTTLCRTCFPKKPYVSLEDPGTREYAQSDPRGFLAEYQDGAILDEIQRAPELPSYLQGIVDENKVAGQFILTGSQNFEVLNVINQSLAGRTALLKLLPFAYSEIVSLLRNKSVDHILLTGFYPRIYDEKLDPTEALSFYFETYVERDIRSLIHIKNLSLFQKFVRLCAGRVGQLLNLASLGNEVGISHTTAREWLTLLEASYIIYLLKPHHKNYNKRISKSPKLYFYDVGLAAYLLDIQNTDQMKRDPLRGSLFENFIIIELLKQHWNEGRRANLSFFCDSNKNEVDLIFPGAKGLAAIEIKSAETITPRFFKGLHYIEAISQDPIAYKALIYGGKVNQKRTSASVYSYSQCETLYQVIMKGI